jgi:hypothetical protein
MLEKKEKKIHEIQDYPKIDKKEIISGNALIHYLDFNSSTGSNIFFCHDPGGS